MPNRFFPGYQVRRFDWGVEIFHIIFMALLIAVVVMLVVWLVRGSQRGHLFHDHVAVPPGRAVSDTALQEARMRYARGEMSREEFLQISTDLGGPAAVQPPEPPPSE